LIPEQSRTPFLVYERRGDGWTRSGLEKDNFAANTRYTIIEKLATRMSPAFAKA